MTNGCEDDEISFENPVVNSYVNPKAPDDYSCHVFHSNGGGMSWSDPPGDALDPSQEGVGIFFGQYLYTGIVQVYRSGTDCADSSCTDLVLWLPNLHESVCEVLNEMNDVPSIQSGGLTNMNGAASNYFRGNYIYTNANSVVGSGMPFEGKSSACYTRSVASPTLGLYTFFSTLLAR